MPEKFENNDSLSKRSRAEGSEEEAHAIEIRKEIMRTIESSPAVQVSIKFNQWLETFKTTSGDIDEPGDTDKEAMKALRNHPDVKLYEIL